MRCATADGGGCNLSDKRCRLCSWGVSVVSLSPDGTWECVGTSARFLDGFKGQVLFSAVNSPTLHNDTTGIMIVQANGWNG